MLRLILAGCNGRMGRELVSFCSSRPDVEIVAGISRSDDRRCPFPIFTALTDSVPAADAVLDFSSPAALDSLLPFCVANDLPVVLGVTGYSPQHHTQIVSASAHIPIFQSANLSSGSTVLCRLAQIASAALGGDFDQVIIEQHHKMKTDRPSGTAEMLARYLRGSADVLSLRAGSTIGEHTVLFAGNHETLILTHRIDSRAVFASGAIRAARFAAKIGTPGLYGMEDLI